MNENTFYLDFNVTGEERKRLVRAISEYTGADSRYLGVPSCAYQVDYFTISKDGCVSFDDRADSEEIEGLIRVLVQQGFVSQVSNLGIEDPDEEPVVAHQGGETTEADTLADEAPEGNSSQENAEADTLADEATEGEPAETEGVEENHPEDEEDERNIGEDPDGDEDEEEEEEEEEDAGMTACIPMDGLDDWALENLQKLITAKGVLIRKALSADRLDINIGEGELEFPWWDSMPAEEEVQAYLDFITAITRMAREAKRVTAREKEVENEKYAFRCFLLRLGFVGPSYKAQRKILLRNLSGSSAFSTQNKAEAFNQVQKAKRDAKKAAENSAPSDEGNGEDEEEISSGATE